MKRSNGKILHTLTMALVLVAALAQPACTVTRMDPVGAEPLEIAREVDIGDYIRVFTKDDTKHEFEVTRLNSKFIGGEDVEIRYVDIAHLDVRNVDEWQTAFAAANATLSVVALVALVALIVIIATI